MSASTSAPPDAPAARARRGPALRAAAVVFGVGVLARAVFLVWHPPLDQHVYDVADVRAHGPGTWLVMHALVGGPGVALSLAGLAVLVGAACPRRGSVLATAGGLLASPGGLAFCVAIGAEGIAWWYATADGVLAPEAQEVVMAAFAAHPLPIDVPALAGSLAGALGVLALALWRARVVAWWLAAAPVALAVLSAVPLSLPSAVAWALAAAEVVVLLALGLSALRSGLSAPAR